MFDVASQRLEFKVYFVVHLFTVPCFIGWGCLDKLDMTRLRENAYPFQHC